MKAIWKYQLQRITDEFAFEMPEGSIGLKVMWQGDMACLWMLVDPDNPKVYTKFFIFGTGHHTIPETGVRYIDSFQQMNGQFIWHLFQEEVK